MFKFGFEAKDMVTEYGFLLLFHQPKGKPLPEWMTK